MFRKPSIIGSAILILGLTVISQVAQAKTQFHRLAWDKDPAHSAIVGFSPKFDVTRPFTRDRRVKWGYSTDERLWKTVKPIKRVFYGSAVPLSNLAKIFRGPVINGILPSYFARLSGLRSDSRVYYRVCETVGTRILKRQQCGQRFWFKTASTKETPFVFVAGGDTRGGGELTNLIGLKPGKSNRAGNELVSKIRPLFVMHGGDYTNANSARQWRYYLNDWQLTHAYDRINGQNYKQIFPIIPAFGNHEGAELDTLCKVFGVDYNRDNRCDYRDTYGALNVSPLMRAYVLNTQLKSAADRSKQAVMNKWLAADLKNHHTYHKNKWRVGQYHKPIFPNQDSKSNNYDQFTGWARPFYDYGMNLVVESDSHIVKSTFPLQPVLTPNDQRYIRNNAGGTVFVGEGSWAAKTRTPNNAQGSLIMDKGSFNQFKVVTVHKDRMEVRTAKFDWNEQRLTRKQRDNDRTLLPWGVNWWYQNAIKSNVMTLSQNSRGQSIFSRERLGSVNVQVRQSSDDAEERPNGSIYLNSSDLELINDRGRQGVGVRFQNINIPQGATITRAYIQFTTDERDKDFMSVNIHAHNVDNSPTFTMQNNNIYSRIRGNSNKVNWRPSEWYTIGKARNTPEIKGLVQQVVNRTGWKQGNSMSFIFSGTQGTRTAEAYDGSRSQAPRLVVNFKY